jgi:signal transduction histidine kinase
VRSARPPGSAGAYRRNTPGRKPPGEGAAPSDVDESRLEQLIGVHSSKTGYYVQWRGTRRDLERALAGLRAMSDALCVTALGPVALCDAVLDAVGRLFDAEWAILVLTGEDLPSTVPSRFTWCREPAPRARTLSAEDSAALAARIMNVPQVMAAGDGAPQATVLGVPMRLDHRQVGSLLIGTENPADPDGIGMSVLETVANQIVAALRNAWLLEHGEDLRQQAIAGRAEAERHALELASRNDQLRRARGQLARARQAELVSAERHRIARDLHDGVAQCLVGIGMHLEWCHRHLDAASPAYGRLVASKELARAGLGRVRSAVAELSELERPGTGLGQALRDLAADFRSAGPLRVSVRVGANQRQLSPEIEHSLVQIAQEGLWNVVRHAGAAQAWLDLRYRTGETRLSISDDGRGDPAVASHYLSGATRARGRYGLRNIAERAAELGGGVRVERRRGGGLRIQVRVPDADAVPVPGTGPVPQAAAGLAPP